MYFLGGARGQDTQMGVAYSEDLLHWTEALDHPVLSSRPGTFDSQVVEPGPPPVLTSEGIFLIYNGADRKSTRLNSSHGYISYAVFCLKKKKHNDEPSKISLLFQT